MRQVPLRLVLIVPFVLQVVGAVGLVSYLSYRSGQESVNELITKLRNETTTRVVQYLDNYLATPVLINQINADAVRLGYLDLQNTNKISIYLINQLQKFKNISHILLGTEQGNFIVASQILMVNQKRTPTIILLDPVKAHQFNQYLVDQNGKIIRFYNSSPFPKVQERPWYQQAVKAGKPIRVPIFQLSNNYSLSLNSSHPIYNPKTNQLLGVFSAASDLLYFREFLANLRIGKTGRLFIIERNGLLIGTSTNQAPYLRKNEQGKIILKRIKATDFQDSLIQSTSRYLQTKFVNFTNIKHNQALDFIQDNHRNFVQVVPYQDKLGLDWLIVTVIPESDFMKHIQKNAELTFLLSAITLLIVIGIGILTAQWIAKPILRLSQASQAIANGEWQTETNQTNQIINTKGITEIKMLTDSFHSMTNQLKMSFKTLEDRVKERTSELILANQKLELLATLDGLTNIANRRRFDDYLTIEWQRHFREKQSLALILIDIDYFKSYNDYYGHQGGDNCLTQVAQTLAKIPQRATDLVARYGGEEFVVILPNTNVQQALIVAESMREAISALKIPHLKSKINKNITISLGVASLIPSSANNLEDLIRQADQALFQAKTQGRDRCYADS